MMRSTVDLPAPFSPRIPIFAPGRKLNEMSLMICRLGGTFLPTRNIECTYCATTPSLRRDSADDARDARGTAHQSGASYAAAA